MYICEYNTYILTQRFSNHYDPEEYNLYKGFMDISLNEIKLSNIILN